MASSLIPRLLLHRMWTIHSDIYDHYPICFEWNKSLGSCNYSFKFNRFWLKDQDFIPWVIDRWPRLSPSSSGTDLDILTHKLSLLKDDVKDWINIKGSSMESMSQRLDSDISILLSNSSYGILLNEEQSSLTEIRLEKRNFGSLPFDLATQKSY